MMNIVSRIELQTLLQRIDKINAFRMTAEGEAIEYNNGVEAEWKMLNDIAAFEFLLMEIAALGWKVQIAARFIFINIMPSTKALYEVWLETGKVLEDHSIKFSAKARQKLGKALGIIKDAEESVEGTNIEIRMGAERIILNDLEALVTLFEELKFMLGNLGKIGTFVTQYSVDSDLIRYAKLVEMFVCNE